MRLEIGFSRELFKVAVAFAVEILLSVLTIRLTERCRRLFSIRFSPVLLLGEHFPSRYLAIILQTVDGDTPTNLLISEIDAPDFRAPTIRPRSNFDNIGTPRMVLDETATLSQLAVFVMKQAYKKNSCLQLVFDFLKQTVFILFKKIII